MKSGEPVSMNNSIVRPKAKTFKDILESEEEGVIHSSSATVLKCTQTIPVDSISKINGTTTVVEFKLGPSEGIDIENASENVWGYISVLQNKYL